MISPNITMTLREVPVRMGGAAGGALQTGQRLGGAVGTAVLPGLYYLTLDATHANYREAVAVAVGSGVAVMVCALAVAVLDLRRSRSTAGGRPHPEASPHDPPPPTGADGPQAGATGAAAVTRGTGPGVPGAGNPRTAHVPGPGGGEPPSRTGLSGACRTSAAAAAPAHGDGVRGGTPHLLRRPAALRAARELLDPVHHRGHDVLPLAVVPCPPPTRPRPAHPGGPGRV